MRKFPFLASSRLGLAAAEMVFDVFTRTATTGSNCTAVQLHENYATDSFSDTNLEVETKKRSENWGEGESSSNSSLDFSHLRLNSSMHAGRSSRENLPSFLRTLDGYRSKEGEIFERLSASKFLKNKGKSNETQTPRPSIFDKKLFSHCNAKSEGLFNFGASNETWIIRALVVARAEPDSMHRTLAHFKFDGETWRTTLTIFVLVPVH